MTEHSKISESLAKRVSRVQQGGARAAVLGVNDGLVSTLCLIVGIAAAGANQQAVVLAGFAGLLAGAISMAAGEWISVKAQVELFEGILGDLKKEARMNKDQLVRALSEALTSHGMPQKNAQQASRDIAKDNKHFLSFYSSQVIGLNPEELGSPWRAAYSSFLLFAAGSLVPLVIWLFTDGVPAVIISIILTAVASVFVGGFVAYSSGKSIVYGALRQLLIVLGSAIVVYAIGHLFGVAVA